MTGGINAPEFLLLLLIAVVVVGPERLPTYAAQLGRIIRELRKMARGATEKVKEEMGDSFGDLSDLTLVSTIRDASSVRLSPTM